MVCSMILMASVNFKVLLNYWESQTGPLGDGDALIITAKDGHLENHVKTLLLGVADDNKYFPCVYLSLVLWLLKRQGYQAKRGTGMKESRRLLC